ncbi:MAG: hypothetical protein HY348_11140 [Nitrospira defluvii]|nr:hypothetical protein [Nitrospira defluvii]
MHERAGIWYSITERKVISLSSEEADCQRQGSVPRRPYFMAKPVRRLKTHTPRILSAPLSPYQRPIELTKREQMILNHVWLGAQNQAIADDLRISVRTVEAHRAMIMRKFGVTNVAQLLRAALLGGVLELR